MDFEGLLFRSDALASGVTDGQLRHARLRGELIAVRPGAFVSAAFFATLNSEQQHLLLARAIAHEAPVVLSHQSAAIAWGMDVWALPLAHVHSTTGRTITARNGRRRIVHGSTLSESESTVFQGLSLTTPARTVVDIARSTTFERAVCVGDSALRRGLVTRTELDEALCSARHRTGIQNAVRAVAAMTDRSDSVGESRTRLILVDAGFAPLLNQSVYDACGTFLGRTDFLFTGPWGCFEFDGADKYGVNAADTRASVLAEKDRENRIRDAGWPFARASWRDLAQPNALTERVRRMLVRGARMPEPEGTFRAEPLPPYRP
ncbi:hypothetical protein [Rhodococcoides fascians]|uniref:hypothetical protein n=1 Tax=Rhodococcoides fascians TaxID=1828 RepID=UPI00055F08A0|nr:MULTISPECIES: hypothetical protein [Rhodococcus]OZF05403.1 hypothetical protein CH301_03140 [Rhodococcus sp. 15-1189-1-1a]OZF20189.1 hypothetical protein CH299_03685 [Rhodococcus sp. 14-2686-1-2]